MLFTSTRNPQHQVGFSAALTQGLAPDGGLYVPTQWPTPRVDADPTDLAAVAAQALQPFAEGDALQDELPAIVREAFNFPAPLVTLDAAQRLSVLELFHGPTAAFKDFGARFLAAAFSRLRGASPKPLKILVATSGDTGGAVAAAFHRHAGIEVAVLFPKGLVSPTQEQQLTCWGENVRSFRVHGRFDDCQRLVKEAFSDAALRQRFDMSSANSINLGRLLPQSVYYWSASLNIWRAHGERASFIIPSGNLGNSTACLWAKAMGAPIDQVVLAHNANRTVLDYLATGEVRPRASIATLSSAMDVGHPSNLERLIALYPHLASLRAAVSAVSIDDQATLERIKTDFEHFGRVWCPHTAVAAEAYARLAPEVRARGRWVVVSTAHPAKFREIVEPVIGRKLPMPDNLARLFDRPANSIELEPTLDALERAL